MAKRKRKPVQMRVFELGRPSVTKLNVSFVLQVHQHGQRGYGENGELLHVEEDALLALLLSNSIATKPKQAPSEVHTMAARG